MPVPVELQQDELATALAAHQHQVSDRQRRRVSERHANKAPKACHNPVVVFQYCYNRLSYVQHQRDTCFVNVLYAVSAPCRSVNVAGGAVDYSSAVTLASTSVGTALGSPLLAPLTVRLGMTRL